jgi:hypothetical protein
MKRLTLALIVTALAACSTGGMSGDYGGPKCMYQKLSFHSGGKMTVTVFGMEMPAEYEVNGDKITMKAHDGRALVFTRKGDVLDAGVMQCVKL